MKHNQTIQLVKVCDPNKSGDFLLVTKDQIGEYKLWDEAAKKNDPPVASVDTPNVEPVSEVLPGVEPEAGMPPSDEPAKRGPGRPPKNP